MLGHGLAGCYLDPFGAGPQTPSFPPQAWRGRFKQHLGIHEQNMCLYNLHESLAAGKEATKNMYSYNLRQPYGLMGVSENRGP